MDASSLRKVQCCGTCKYFSHGINSCEAKNGILLASPYFICDEYKYGYLRKLKPGEHDPRD